MIFEDVLYSNKNFDAESMCIDRFKSIPTTRLLPVFKYVSAFPDALARNEKLKCYVNNHNTIDLIIPSNISKQIKNLPVLTTYDSLLAEINIIDDLNKKAGILLMNLEFFTPDIIRSVCCTLFELNRNDAMRSTHFKRCVMYLDLMEHGATKEKS